jgi:Fur family ferric uptake transcriptional regulator
VTHAAERPPLPFGDLGDVAAVLRREGGRLSAARRVVLEALFAADGPVTAEALADGLGGRFMRLELSSVYRNLERLEELGVVRHVHLAHGPGLYSLARGGMCEYLVCDRCSQVRSVPATALDEVRALIREQTGHEARFGHFPIHGVCAECARTGP